MTQLTRGKESLPISSTPEGRRGVSIYANEAPFTDQDFIGVIIALKQNYPQLKDTPANAMYFSLIKTAVRRMGFSSSRLKEAVMAHIMSSEFPPKVSDIVSYDKLVEVLGWRNVEYLSWPHEPVAKLYLPNGNFEFVWEKDMLPEYGYKWEHYETPAEHQHKLEMQQSDISEEERNAIINKLIGVTKQKTINENSRRK